MSIDMSSKAITTRLKLASQLHQLCLKLAKAKPVEKEKTSNSKILD